MSTVLPVLVPKGSCLNLCAKWESQHLKNRRNIFRVFGIPDLRQSKAAAFVCHTVRPRPARQDDIVESASCRLARIDVAFQDPPTQHRAILSV